MLFEVWLMVVALAVIVLVIGFYDWRNPVLFLLGAVLWLVVAYMSADIEFMITYSGSDYLKSFRYIPLILFFGALAVINFLLFLYHVLELSEKEVLAYLK